MNVFRKKEEKKSCCCGGNCSPEAIQKVEEDKMSKGIKILGTGCAKCIALEKATITSVEELGLNLDIQHITDMAQIASYGVMTTPALVVNGKVVSYGKSLSIPEIKEILSKE